MKKHVQKVAQDTRVKFAAVGVVNTVIDFSILNLLAHGVGLPRIPSNVVSTSVAMVFSFFVNRSVVFGSEGGNKRRQAILFIIVTVTGVYVLQNGIIYILSDLWTSPLDTLHESINILDKELFITNAAKGIATGASLVWNFLFYQKLVFKNNEK